MAEPTRFISIGYGQEAYLSAHYSKRWQHGFAINRLWESREERDAFVLFLRAFRDGTMEGPNLPYPIHIQVVKFMKGPPEDLLKLAEVTVKALAKWTVETVCTEQKYLSKAAAGGKAYYCYECLGWHKDA